ncbi:short chain type dehydrogenase [Schizopora paradoxa]|uniref:Short chain type dehydrogenase n=1 Tax=Schizopora paradoxa TaxID=27342 RepID=A0A0H2RUX8_9AGAM|nr:short chain type dehydrogenase [Schizopora paradoxa]
MKISNRTFVVSGGSSGLGLATVLDLYNSGAFIAILDVKENHDLMRELGNRGKFFEVDVREVDQLEAAVEETVSWIKETKATLGGVVNCAGVATASKVVDANGETHPLDLWDFTISVNLHGSFNLTRLVCKHLVKVTPEGDDSERGIVILVSSSAAFEGQIGQAAYAASKGAIASMVLPLSRDLASYGVRVNAIAPAAFKSAMSDLLPKKARASLERELSFPRRFGKAEEFAQTVRWLMECGYMNGETVRLSGGTRMPGRL